VTLEFDTARSVYCELIRLMLNLTQNTRSNFSLKRKLIWTIQCPMSSN